MPCVRGRAPIKRAMSASLKATSGSSVAKMSAKRGRRNPAFPYHAAQCLLRLWQVKQLQNNGLVASEHDAAGDTEEGGVGDLPCRAGYGDSDRAA